MRLAREDHIVVGLWAEILLSPKIRQWESAFENLSGAFVEAGPPLEPYPIRVMELMLAAALSIGSSGDARDVVETLRELGRRLKWDAAADAAGALTWAAGIRDRVLARKRSKERR